jgi:hypothetical protein
MGRGWTYYGCQCGGTIHEEWTHFDTFIECDNCNNPIPKRLVEDEKSDLETNKTEEDVNIPF